MSGTVWTKEQADAIATSGCNLLVAAAAGAGKTAVLVERIIQKITDAQKPLNIDALLVVTFTNAAAAEMRERIGLALENALEADPQSEHLQRQLTLLGKASITTLHSFCLDVVRSNFHLIDLDPVFRIADETETTLIKLDILEELFEAKYEDEATPPEFYRLVECYGGGRDDRGLQDKVLELCEFISSHPWPEKWLEEHTEEFNLPEGTDFCSTSWGKIIIKSVKAELAGLLALLESAADTARSAYGLEPYSACLEDDKSQVKMLLDAVKGKGVSSLVWDGLYAAFNSFAPARLPRCGKDADLEAQEQVKAARKEVKDSLSRIIENNFRTTSLMAVKDLRELYPMFRALSELVLEFDQRYAARKKEKSLLDFNDLEHLCLKILTVDGKPSPAAAELRKKFEEILVDEYQDSNLIQEVIIGAISGMAEGRPNVFMVGDVKQSIYRFRQARPELFLSKYNSYPGIPGSENMRILLYKNFRSRPEVINGVNFIFKQIMSELAGELNYTADEALNPGAVFEPVGLEGAAAGGPVEVAIIDLSVGKQGDGSPASGEEDGQPETGELSDGLENDNEEGEKPDAIQAEARMVAKRIRQLVDPSGGSPAFMVWDKTRKIYRNAEYRDIVILLRTTRNWSDVFMEELGLQGIPAYADTGSGYFKTVEIQTVISLLRIIDNPLQDVPLLAVLRSPVFSFSVDELAEIRLAGRSLPFYEAMKRYAECCDGPATQKTRRFLAGLGKWRDKARHMSTDGLIWYLYSDTSYYSYAGILPGGAQRQANLKMLFEKARQYEETSYKGLFNFVNFVDRLKSGGGDMGSARILGENENVVRIMSIHKSKGLEFPIVFVSGCGKKFNLSDMTGKILLHQDLGFGPDLVDIERRITYPVISKQALKYKVRQETLSEEMRILYVAFTRAREKLIITGAVKDFEKAAGGWGKSAGADGEKLREYDMLKAGSYLDWICPALARHKDGGVLRPSAAAVVPGEGSVWDVKIYGMEEAARPVEEEEPAGSLTESRTSNEGEDGAAGAAYEEISRRLDWQYPYRNASGIPAKLSVTELKRRFNLTASEEAATLRLPPPTARPLFLEGSKGFSPAEKGTIMHFIMQHLELSPIREKVRAGSNGAEMENEINQQISGLVQGQFLTEEEAAAADTGRIAAFFRSVPGRRLLASQKVSRETPFNMELNCTEIYRDLPAGIYADETVLLQGIIDCFFEEAGGLILIDYKTDYVAPADMDRIKELYETQILYYAKAIEAITDKKVLEKYIYLFHNGEIVEF